MARKDSDQPSSSKYTLRHDIEEKQYRLTRRAPLPPKFCTTSNPELKFVRGNNSDFVQIRYSNIEHINNTTQLPTESVKECLTSITNKLIHKEEQYVLNLKLLIQKMEAVSTTSCNKLPLLKDILDFHIKLLKSLFQSSHPLYISHLFLKHKMRLELYAEFAKIRNDFSYLVMDLCETIIDHFKERLLEYNFTLSQIKNVYITNLKIRNVCEEAENVVKTVYQNINVAVSNPVI